MSVVSDQPVDDSHLSRRRDLAVVVSGPRLPTSRGPLSATVLSALRQRPGSLGRTPPLAGVDGLGDDDLQLALYCCYEFLHRLRDEIGPSPDDVRGDVAASLMEMVTGASGPSLSTFLLELGTLDQLREFCVHRSAYQLKEADPHTFAIPRLSGDAKAAMVEIQSDEYGSGRAADMHSVLFAKTMTALGRDPMYSAYLDRLPGTTFATVNLASMFGLHPRWRAALVGHLAVFEMTSVEPMGRYSAALARMGIGPEGRRFYDVHVAAVVRHGRIALERMVAGLIDTEPRLGADVLFGAAAVLLVEKHFARDLLDAWATGRSSLLPHTPIDRARISPTSYTGYGATRSHPTSSARVVQGGAR